MIYSIKQGWSMVGDLRWIINDAESLALQKWQNQKIIYRCTGILMWDYFYITILTKLNLRVLTKTNLIWE